MVEQNQSLGETKLCGEKGNIYIMISEPTSQIAEKNTIDDINQKILKSSLVFGFIIAVVAITVGLIISSQIILFAGLTSLLGVVFTYIPLLVLKYIAKIDLKNYPFGKENLEPLMAIMQYIPLIFICAYNIYTAIQVLINGGNEVSVASGVLYGLFSTVFSTCSCGYLIFLAKEHCSPIAEAEIVGWKLEVLVGISLLAGFGIAWVLDKLSFTTVIPYVDPILTIILGIPFSAIPVMACKDAIRECMHARPSGEMADFITDRVENISSGYDFFDKVLRIGKVGSKVIIEIDYIIKKDSKLDNILEQDQLRSRLTQSFAELPYGKWLNVSFTSDIKWTKHVL